MLLRRVFLRWQQVAVIVLPAWLAIGWAIFSASGWSFLGLVITVPSSFLVLGVIALLVSLRPSVRAERAASWIDVAVLGFLDVMLVGAGVYGPSGFAFGMLALAGAIAAFWVTLWQLVSDGSRRMQASMAEYRRMAGAPGQPTAPDGAPPRRPPFDDGDVIVIHEVKKD